MPSILTSPFRQVRTALGISGLLLIASVALFPSSLQAHESHTIRITDEAYVPASIEISEGDTVVFINESDTLRWPASNLHPTHTTYPGTDIRDCETGSGAVMFDSCRGLKKGEKFEFTFLHAGTWKFHDHLFATMGGSITVRGTAGDNAKNMEGSIGKGTSLTKLDQFTFPIVRKLYSLLPILGERKLTKLNIMDIAREDRDLEYWMRIFGYERLLDKLIIDAPSVESEGILSGVDDGRCHREGHYLGRMAYRVEGLTLLDELGMDMRCQFGFYHGVLELSLGNLGDDHIIEDMAQQCRQYEKDAMRRFFCLHVIGHGLVIYHNYDLPLAVDKCYGLLETDFERLICYHGAFMENVFASIDIAAPGHETTWIDSTRPNFPCDLGIFRKYSNAEEQCYFNQSIVWAEQPITNFDEHKAFEGCLQAPFEVRDLCFGGVGFNLILLATSLSTEEVIKKCKNASEEKDQRSCLIGALFLHNTPAWSTYGFRHEAYCAALDMPNLYRCDRNVRDILSWLFNFNLL